MFRTAGCMAAVLILLVFAGAVFAAEDVAKVGELAGSVMVQRPDAGPASAVAADTVIQAGDRLTCTADSSVRITFENGTILNLVGPADMAVVSFTDEETKICLVTGLINLARARGATLNIETEYSVRVSVSESTAYAEVKPGQKIVFANIKGEGVKVHLPGEERSLEAGDLPFPINLTKLKVERRPFGVPEGSDGPTSAQHEYLLGRRVIRVYPHINARPEWLPNGGLRLTGVGLGANEFVRVEVGYEAVLYLGAGESVVFDQYGNVDEFSGTAFVDRPIERRSFYFEPIRDAADSSTIRTRAR